MHLLVKQYQRSFFIPGARPLPGGTAHTKPARREHDYSHPFLPSQLSSCLPIRSEPRRLNLRELLHPQTGDKRDRGKNRKKKHLEMRNAAVGGKRKRERKRDRQKWQQPGSAALSRDQRSLPAHETTGTANTSHITHPGGFGARGAEKTRRQKEDPVGVLRSQGDGQERHHCSVL